MAHTGTSPSPASPRQPALPWLRVVGAPVSAFAALCGAYAIATHACTVPTKPWHMGLFALAALGCGACLTGLYASWRTLPKSARAARFVHVGALALACFSLLLLAAFVIVFVMVKRCD